MVPGRPQALILVQQRVEGRVARFQGECRIARAEPCFVEIVRLGGQSCASLDQGLRYLVRRRLAAGENLTRKISGVGECTLGTGSFVQYELPFQLQVTAFRFGFSTCGAERFLDWAFEAFDGEEWRRLLHSRTSPWPGGFYLGGDGAVVFQLWYPFASTRFRIRLLEPALSMHAHRCMHIRGLELYGTIMPPWRID